MARLLHTPATSSVLLTLHRTVLILQSSFKCFFFSFLLRTSAVFYWNADHTPKTKTCERDIYIYPPPPVFVVLYAVIVYLVRISMPAHKSCGSLAFLNSGAVAERKTLFRNSSVCFDAVCASGVFHPQELRFPPVEVMMKCFAVKCSVQVEYYSIPHTQFGTFGAD